VKRYETREITTSQQIFMGEICDGCGITSTDAWPLVAVAIEVHVGEEGGSRDEYDYCDGCLVARAPALAAAGSKAPLVTADELERGTDHANAS
jgi:hypothetical protein